MGREYVKERRMMLSTHGYKKNLDSAVGNELDLYERDDNEHGWLTDDGKEQVGYVPATYLMIIIDETLQEEESDKTRKEGHWKRTDVT